MDSEPVAGKPEVDLGRRHPPLGVLFAVLVLLIGAAATFWTAETIMFDWFAWGLPLLAVIAGRIGVMFGIAVALVVLSLTCWKHPQRRKASGAAGALFLVATVAAFLQGIIATAMIISAADSYRNYSAYLTQVNAVVTKLEAGRISVNGPIGPTLMEDIGRLHGPSESIKTIEISSEGGLVHVAFALARMVEDQKISVVVNDYCLSACILIAVASPESYAEKTAVFGFHRISSLADITTEIWQYAISIQDTEAREFLRQHGVPESVLAESDKHGPDTVYEVSAKYMVDVGAIKGLMFNGEVVAVGPKR